jgi:hypothetical protein
MNDGMTMPDSGPAAGPWRLNYFNYFTEAEEHFQRARGTGLFLLSPLDWALLESWKNSGVPLEAVLRGIEAAFAKWRARKHKTQAVNSVAYCAQAVLREAEAMANNLPSPGAAPPAGEASFPIEAVRAYLEKALAALRAAPGYGGVAGPLATLLENLETHFADLQQLDQRLTALEDKMAAIARATLPDEDLFEMRRELDHQLRPYRGKMTADQIARLEKSFLDRKVYEKLALPRLSLFYL